MRHSTNSTGLIIGEFQLKVDVCFCIVLFGRLSASFYYRLVVASTEFKAEFKEGMKAFAAVSPGTVAWGLMTGVALAQSGMDFWAAVLMCTWVFAGSATLATTPLIAAGAPLTVIWLTTLCVNLRFVVFSLQLRPYMQHLPWWRRWFSGYITADNSFVMFMSRHPAPATDALGRAKEQGFLLGTGCSFWVVWTLSTLAGLIGAQYIPAHWGLGFLGILSLLAILCNLVTSRLQVLAVLVAGGFATLVYALPFKLNIVASISVAVIVCLLTERTLKKALTARGAA
jgi:predicted branched-subunit amino acid permease